MVNKVILIGNLGRDPELRRTANGMAVANFTMATTETWNNRNGEREQHTEWHRIVCWGRLAERISEQLSKGRQVYVEGRLQTREWEDREGTKRRTTEINARTVLMVGRRSDYGDEPSGGSSSYEPQEPSEGGDPGGDSDKGSGALPPDDDIPF
jgi:single-strand DNA-binding protein